MRRSTTPVSVMTSIPLAPALGVRATRVAAERPVRVRAGRTARAHARAARAHAQLACRHTRLAVGERAEAAGARGRRRRGRARALACARGRAYLFMYSLRTR